MYGGIGGYVNKEGSAMKFRSFFMVANTTNSKNTVEFLELLSKEAPVASSEILVVSDNHSAHLSKLV